MNISITINIEGIVQGVGFRPFICNLANSLNIKGRVCNDSRGVEIVAEGSESLLSEFIELIKSKKPIKSEITLFEVRRDSKLRGYEDFSICKSKISHISSAIVPVDSTICQNCLNEIRDKRDRRFDYPFVNCTDCGPRYTIIKSLPYDRKNSSMDSFVMCPSCQREYEDSSSRRFHAQPNSCPKCGPKLTLYKSDNRVLATNIEALDMCAKLLKQGSIVAIKGVGGFALVCSSKKSATIKSLRARKRRASKPFAVMFRSIYEIKKCTIMSEDEERLILSYERPIVLLKKRKSHRLEKFCISSEKIAPKIDRLGVILPYSPLHVLIMDRVKIPLVFTSANISGTPIVKSKEELKERLFGVYDFYLDYDRDILHSIDDSVACINSKNPLLLRRARGFAPCSFALKGSFLDEVLCVGALQKSAISLCKNGTIALFPYIGDLGEVQSNDYFEKSIYLALELYRVSPKVVVCDLHSGYYSAKWAMEFAKSRDIELLQIEHHYAHALSLMCEHKIESEILCITWDGTGLGSDGTIWGGEFLEVGELGFSRVGHIDRFKLLGGESSIKEPKRVGLSILIDIYGDEIFNLNAPFMKNFSDDELKVLYKMHNNSINSPLCSSIGRLFDGVCAILGILIKPTYEGEAGLMLESLYDESIDKWYDFKIEDGVIYYKSIFKELLYERDIELAATKFINTLAYIVYEFAKDRDLPCGLSGGVFQNMTLCRKIASLFEKDGMKLFQHSKIPCNDSGISVGQAYYCYLRDKKEKRCEMN